MTSQEPQGMFSELTHAELNTLFARLGSGMDAHRNSYGVRSEIGDVREDVRGAIVDITHAEFAQVHAQGQAELARRTARAEAGDPEAFLDFF